MRGIASIATATTTASATAPCSLPDIFAAAALEARVIYIAARLIQSKKDSLLVGSPLQCRLAPPPQARRHPAPAQSLLCLAAVAVDDRGRGAATAVHRARGLLLLERERERIVFGFLLRWQMSATLVCLVVDSLSCTHLLWQLPCDIVFRRQALATFLQRSKVAGRHHA